MTVEAGWKIGHRHDEYFDLFRGETFPAIGFGRFADVFTSQTTTVAATDPEAVVAALAANPGVELDDLGTTTVAGLPTRVVDVRVTQAQTHLFRGEDELNSDPGFVQRCHLIAVPGGVLLVSVLTDEGNLAGALALTESVIESIEVESAP